MYVVTLESGYGTNTQSTYNKKIMGPNFGPISLRPDQGYRTTLLTPTKRLSD